MAGPKSGRVRPQGGRPRPPDAAGAFEAAYGAKFPKAVAKITGDLDQLLAFYDYPAEHWVHLRTTNPIESTFATVRHRTKITRGPGSRAAGLAIAFKLIEAAQDRWRAVNAPTSSPWSAPAPLSSTGNSSNDPARRPSQKRPKNHDPQVLTIAPSVSGKRKDLARSSGMGTDALAYP